MDELKKDIMFVNPPTYEPNCPVCFELLKDAYQTTCCGNHICSNCTERLKCTPNIKCPQCRHDNFEANEDKFFSRQLLNLKVHCYYHKEGCTWTGELHGLEQHVTTNCNKGVIKCKHCNSQYADEAAVEEHLPNCGEIPIDCPNKCSNSQYKRKDIQHHLETECPLRVIVHSNGSIPYTANKIVQTVPLSFTMTNYMHYLESRDPWFSPPFYTHKQGYKIHLRVDVNNLHKNGNASVVAFTTKGEYDHLLQWPLHAEIEVGLFNWRDNTSSYTKTLYLSGDYFCSQMPTDKLAEWGKGIIDFIPNDELCYNPDKNTEYLQHNCLSFQVKRVTILPNIVPDLPPWAVGNCLCQFTITSFTKNKERNASFYGPPFYTNSRGYKLVTFTFLNGFNTTKGTHMSLCAILMKGEHDDTLPWPFTGDVVVEMINWREDKNHQEYALSFHKGLSSTSTDRVLTAGIASTGCEVQSVPHSTLSYNHTTNTEFLRNDCIHIKVKSVDVYSSHSIPKGPSWQNPQTVNPYLEFSVTNFSKRKALGTKCIGPAFSTHYQGYKLQLEVKANKKNNDHYVSVYAYLLKGENDHNHVWPFQADITVQLLNWRQNANHHNHIISFNGRTPDEYKNRVITGEKALNSWGTHEFILCSKLGYNHTTNTEYLQNDCLRFKVKEVVVYSTPHCSKSPIWQNQQATKFIEFTISQFSHRIRLKSTYFSPPFYTFAYGYKMCLKVCPAGNVGTHVAIYGFLMKGEYDDYLSWPFYADIVIDILNWRGDHSHHRKVLNFDESSPDKARARVYSVDGLAPNSWGIYEVIPISTLYPRYASNTEYLEEDCMRIRIYDIAIYNTPLLNKIPRWQNSQFTSSPWLEFTVTGFYKRKIYDSVYHSPPFYTHKNGYKMRLEANPNGCGDGKDTHLSLFARLLKGENDCNLKWPMNIDIGIQLINWRKDGSHIFYSIRFANAVSGARYQVMGAKEEADSSWGNQKFCAHSTLYTATYNVQYIEDDCIRLRIQGIMTHSRYGFY